MLKILKQELLFIPLLLLLIEVFRAGVSHFYPDTALFDRGSLLESFLVSLWEISWISVAAWIVLRVVFPEAYNNLKRFYTDFYVYKSDFKDSFAQKLWLTIFLSLVFLVGMRGATPEQTLRFKLKDTLYSQLNVREATGHNDGFEVERYLNFVGQKAGVSWCAAFTSYNLHAVGIDQPINPVSAWAPSFGYRYVIWSEARVKSRTALSPQTGDCFTLYYPNLGRIGHVGFIVGAIGQSYITIEGNTAVGGTREGSGVHSLKRSKAKVYTVSNYITPYLSKNEKAFNTNAGYRHSKLLSKTYAKRSIRHSALERQYLCSTGFNLLHATNCKTAGRSFETAGYSFNRRPLPTIYGHGVYRDCQSKSLSFDFKRAAQRELRLQGQRGVDYCAKSPNKKVPTVCGKATEVKQYCKSSNRTVYTETC